MSIPRKTRIILFLVRVQHRIFDLNLVICIMKKMIVFPRWLSMSTIKSPINSIESDYSTTLIWAWQDLTY